MSLTVILALVAGPLLLTVAALAARSATRGRLDASREWRWVRLTWAVSVGIGITAAWTVDRSLGLGRGTMLVPAVLGLFVVAGVGLAETVVRPPRPTGVRTASLAPRRVSDYLPRTLAITVGGIATLHLIALALTTATASTDDLGHAGRQVAARCGDVASAAGPYPGSFYSLPLALLLGAIALATGAALVAVVRRPRGFAPDEVSDDALRRRSAARVLAAAGAAVTASHVGIAFFAGGALLRLDCQQAWMEPAGWVLLGSAVGCLPVLGWLLGRIVLPGSLPAADPVAAAREIAEVP